MKRLFGTGKKEEKQVQNKQEQKVEENNVQKTVQENPIHLGTESKKVEAKINELTQVINGLDQEIRDLMNKMKTANPSKKQMYKQKALMLMKKKKLYDQQISTLLQNQFAMDSISFTQENIQMTIDTANTMKQANEVQKKMIEKIDYDQLDDIRDDMEEMMYEQKEMQEAMNFTNFNVNVDESELDAELNQYAMEMQINNIPNVNFNKQNNNINTNNQQNQQAYSNLQINK